MPEACVADVHRQEFTEEGKRGNSESERSSTFLQLSAMPRSAGIPLRAKNPRPVRLGHSRPQTYSMVCERLSAVKPLSLATAPWPINIRSRGMAAMWCIASSSQ
jgi:hypothetical protein